MLKSAKVTPQMFSSPSRLSSVVTACGLLLVLIGPAPSRAIAEDSAATSAELPDAPGEIAQPVLLIGGPELQTSSSVNNQQPPPGAPSLGDLGLSADQTQGDSKRQALLDRRTHMLKVHQRLGLITVLPVAAACISSIGAPPDHGQYGNTTARDIHVGLGGLAVAMYGATAYYAIRAPKAGNEPARGGIKLHKYLIYLHAPGMVLTPILGAIAFNQINSGQKVHGIASAHGAVASVTAVSYGAAILAVTWPLHFKY